MGTICTYPSSSDKWRSAKDELCDNAGHFSHNPVHPFQEGRTVQGLDGAVKDFAAIDFETANECPSSVCSVGVVVVRDGQIADTFYSLIHPEPEYFNWFCQRAHGLCPADTDSAPAFPYVWEKIAPIIGGLPLVAHNSRFDEGCLKAVFRVYRMDYPDYEFHDTLAASRRYFGRSLPDHQLQTVAAACGYVLTLHHHALADAEACAFIAMKIL